MSDEELDDDGAPKRGYGDWREDAGKKWRDVVRDLTPFERRFVEAYLKCDSGAEAARVAGSNAKNLEQVAYNTKKRPHVMTAIAVGLNYRIQAAALDDNEVIMKLREVFDAAMEDGKYAEANKAAELLGKTIGLFGNPKSVDARISQEAREQRDRAERERELEADGKMGSMLSILSNARLREGTADDPRLQDSEGA